MVHFVGAGPGAPDLITLRGAQLLKQADVIIYAGSLVNPALLELAKADCRIYNSAEMTLEQVLAVMVEANAQGRDVVRLHTGTPVFTARSGSRSTSWTSWVSAGTTPPASPAFSARRRPWARSTPCPASARA